MSYGSNIFDFNYSASGTPIGFKYTTAGTTTGAYYYYGVNSRGDIEALYNSSGTQIASYSYDAYGKPISTNTLVSGYSTVIAVQPLRYRSYIYDTETGLYYLQSRYYDPTTCRFVNADAIATTASGLNGLNLFAYCSNNPIMYSDPSGFCPVYIPSCPECNDEVKALHDERGADWATYRNVTKEVNDALLPEVLTAKIVTKGLEQLNDYEKTIAQAGVLYYFKTQVDHEAPWDIKLEIPWEQTIGTSYPGSNTQVIYEGIKMTPQQLGNYTYGYLGRAYEIPLVVLYGGSYYAAGFPTGEDLEHEVSEDWKYVTLGYYGY